MLTFHHAGPLQVHAERRLARRVHADDRIVGEIAFRAEASSAFEAHRVWEWDDYRQAACRGVAGAHWTSVVE